MTRSTGACDVDHSGTATLRCVGFAIERATVNAFWLTRAHSEESLCHSEPHRRRLCYSHEP
jgi:hypothetical protein